MKDQIIINWRDQVIPDYDGLIRLNQNIPDFREWQDFVIQGKEKIEDERIEILFGECTGHGSIGAIVAQDIETEKIIWSYLSSDSNPFDSIVIQPNEISAKSTSGALVTISPIREPTTTKLIL